MQNFDKVVLGVTGVALLIWVAWPQGTLSAVTLLAAGVMQLARLSRWQGLRTGAEPLVWVLHLGYLFLPLGALAMGTAILLPSSFPQTAAQHLWTAGAVGLMTLAVMTRATLGHTGRVLHAGWGTTALYLAMIIAAGLRFAAGFWPGGASQLYAVSGALWIAAFVGFSLTYGLMLVRPKI